MRPYRYHKMSKAELEQNDDLMNFPGFKRIEVVEKYDLLADSQIKVSKIFGTTPTAIGTPIVFENS